MLIRCECCNLNLMEKLPKQERKSAVMRIVGGEEGLEQKGMLEAEKLFEKGQEFKEHEVEKTPEQKEIIAFLNEKLPEFIEKYGGQPLGISEDKVHVLPEEFWKKAGIAGYYVPDPRESGVYIKQGKEIPLAAFTKTLIHEFMHFNSFQSITTYKGERRTGFSIYGKKDEKSFAYFKYVDEAVIEELTKRFCEEYLRQVPSLKKEREEFEKTRKKAIEGGFVPKKVAEDIAYEVVREKNGEKTVAIVSYSYQKEREKLNILIDGLYEKNKDQFHLREEVFALFTKSLMSGRLLPLARLVEKTYGKGVFREIGEISGDKSGKVVENR